MSISTNDLKNGMALDLPEGLMTVVEFQHVKPGKGGAFVRTKLKNYRTGAVLDRTFRADEKVPLAVIDKREMQFLYRETDDFVFMDNETYDQITLNQEAIGDGAVFLRDGMVVTIQSYESTPLSVALPDTVVMEIVEADPVVKGQTASSSYKPAKLENGVRVMVPPHIAAGTRIVVNTADGSYVERAKD